VKEKELQDSLAGARRGSPSCKAESKRCSSSHEHRRRARREVRRVRRHRQGAAGDLEKNQARARRTACASSRAACASQTERGDRGDAEVARLEGELADARPARPRRSASSRERSPASRATSRRSTTEKAESSRTSTRRSAERDGRIASSSRSSTDTVERKDRQEAELQSQIQEKLEKIGELEGEVEAAKQALADREAELQGELGDVGGQLQEAQGVIEANTAAIAELNQTSGSARRPSTASTPTSPTATRASPISKGRFSSAQQTIADRDGEIGSAQADARVERGQRDRRPQSAWRPARREISRPHHLAGRDAEGAAADAGHPQPDAGLSSRRRPASRKRRPEPSSAPSSSSTRPARSATSARASSSRPATRSSASPACSVRPRSAKAQLEEQLSGEIGQLKTSLSEAQGNYEAEASAHQQLEKRDVTAAIAQLTNERDGLAGKLEQSPRSISPATRSNLDDTAKSLDIEKRALADTRSTTKSASPPSRPSSQQTREQAQDLWPSSSPLTKQELGARVSDLTQLNAKLAHAEDARAQPRRAHRHLTEESQRREELLQNDVAAKSKELADTLRKLSTQQQEKVRQVDALTREVTAKTELSKQLELKLKSLFDESKKKTDELSGARPG
jgi:ParB family chromosome partitioning protein